MLMLWECHFDYVVLWYLFLSFMLILKHFKPDLLHAPTNHTYEVSFSNLAVETCGKSCKPLLRPSEHRPLITNLFRGMTKLLRMCRDWHIPLRVYMGRNRGHGLNQLSEWVLDLESNWKFETKLDSKHEPSSKSREAQDLIIEKLLHLKKLKKKINRKI